MRYRAYILLFVTLAMGLFGVLVAEYVTPSEPFHNGGFGANENYSLPNATDRVNSTNSMKYRIIHRSGDVFYIGGRGIFYRIDPHSSTCGIASPNVPIGICAEGGGALECSKVAPIDKDVDCHNYIRIVEEYEKNSQPKLLVCGTNALTPRCYTFIFDETNCELQLEYPSGGIGENETCKYEGSYDAKGFAPTNWNLNYTYLYSRPPGANEKLMFVGVSKASDEKHPVWANYDVRESYLGTPNIPYTQKLDNYEIESRAVNEANFVGKPYQYETPDGDKFILFFFRETAVEFINHGKIVYSRVGRVCREDAGTTDTKWSSFLKARLNCSLPGDYPAYLNEIQDVSVVEEAGETYFYSVFATPSDGIFLSGLCRYQLSEIHNRFQTSKFKSQASSKSLWLPVDPIDEPFPRPGFSCSNQSDDTSFIKNNPLVDELVDNYNPYETEEKSDAPLIHTDSGGRFSTIAVDHQDDNDIEDNIYYIGTESGNVLKAYNISGGWIVLRYWQQPSKEAITGLEFIHEKDDEGPWLFAATDNTLTKIDLKFGQAQNQEQFDIVYYPYLMGETLSEATGVIVENSPSNITTCDNREISLYCRGKLGYTSGEGSVIWYKENTTVQQLDNKSRKLLREWHNSIYSFDPSSFLTILALEGKTNTTFSCDVRYPGANGEAKDRRETTITVEDCITDDAVRSRKETHLQIEDKANYRSDQYEAGECEIPEESCEESCPFHSEIPVND